MNNELATVLITDDHHIFRNGLINILKRIKLFSKFLEAANGNEALLVAQQHQVDMVLMDIDMPDMNGIEATQKILASNPTIKVIALTMFCNPEHVYEMCKAGIKGYLLKDTEPAEMYKAIRMVLNGEEYYAAKVQAVLTHVLREREKGANSKSEITDTQKKVLRYLCNQMSTDEIAAEMGISSNTVNKHRQELLERTDSINLAGLVLYAVKNKIIEV